MKKYKYHGHLLMVKDGVVVEMRFVQYSLTDEGELVYRDGVFVEEAKIVRQSKLVLQLWIDEPNKDLYELKS